MNRRPAFRGIVVCFEYMYRWRLPIFSKFVSSSLAVCRGHQPFHFTESVPKYVVRQYSMPPKKKAAVRLAFQHLSLSLSVSVCLSVSLWSHILGDRLLHTEVYVHTVTHAVSVCFRNQPNFYMEEMLHDLKRAYIDLLMHACRGQGTDFSDGESAHHF